MVENYAKFYLAVSVWSRADKAGSLRLTVLASESKCRAMGTYGEWFIWRIAAYRRELLS